MTVTKLLKGSALSAIAAAMALTALPTEASAQGREERAQAVKEWRKGQGQQSRQQRREARSEAPRREARSEPRQEQRNVQQYRQDRQANNASRGEERRGRDWNRSDRRAEIANERSTREWNRSDQRERAAIESVPVPPSTAAREGRNSSYADRDRNRSYRDDRRSDRRADRNDSYRDGRRDGYRDGRYADRRDDRRDTRYAYRSGYRDGRHYDRDRDYRRGDYRRWDRHSWRKHHRYNWYDYRRSHHNIYRLGRYYSPYRHHSYSRISIGIYLDNLFFGSRYWISDPWQYRLPEVYGPYRWVRYYDDVLLVNTYTGEVVDVIYDFFW